jgi:hypothetical protein
MTRNGKKQTIGAIPETEVSLICTRVNTVYVQGVVPQNLGPDLKSLAT